jgi:deoxyribodipyrimidine photo-lyase
VVLFNRDLRVHDHPALAEVARRAERVVPLFVLDERLLGSRFACPNRLAFMLESLADLDRSLERLGARLVVRHGEVVREAMAVAEATQADALFVTADVSAYAQRRERSLRQACEGDRILFETFSGVTVVPPGDLVPGGGDHFKVFTPYWRRWRAEPLRALEHPPAALSLPAGVDRGHLPALAELTHGAPSPALAPGGETEGRARLGAWATGGVLDYGAARDDPAADATSRLSPYLRFGCVSPLEVAQSARDLPGTEPFVQQVCWRDFHHQVTAANPAVAHADYRPRGDRWRTAADELQAWKDGLTGYPVVDAGMRQLAEEGWMHNRVRMITASFLCKDLYLDWRLGAAHFWDLLLDGDIPNNAGNWQWIAGTGNDTRPNRVFNPIAQGRRHDPRGEYVRRWVPELAEVDGPLVHEPWRLAPTQRAALDYPGPIVDHAAAVERFRMARTSTGS